MIWKRGRTLASLLLLALLVCATAEEWSWGRDTDSKADTDPGPVPGASPVLQHQEESADTDQKKVPTEGDDRQPRFLGLGLKLCSLGIGDDCPHKKPHLPPVPQKTVSGVSSYTSYTHETQHQAASHQSSSSYTSYSTDPRHPTPHYTSFKAPPHTPHKQVVQHNHKHTHIHHTPEVIPPRPTHHIPHTGDFQPHPSHHGHFQPLPSPHGGVELEGITPEGHHGTSAVHILIPSYKEDCVCVHTSYCADYDVVGRENPGDIHHLIDPRTRGSDILSNDTQVEEEDASANTTTTTTTAPETESRVRRDLLPTTNTTAALAEGRALRYRPGATGCGAAYVCCRNPQPQRPPHNPYTCGRGNPSGVLARVKTPAYIEGTAHFGEFPWHAAVLKDHKEYVCGAVLIDAHHVLTAAHCVQGLSTHLLKVRLGDWDVSDTTEFYSHVEVPAEWVVVHPEYYGGDLSNDLAVIRLKGYLDFAANPHIRPVCLPPSHTNFVGHRCVSTGWGKDAFGSYGKFQSILHKVEVPVVDHRACQAALAHARLGPNFRLSPGALCAGGEEGRDTCEGDGGGPLVCSGPDGAYQLAGLVSWGIGCGRVGVPGVYVDVAHYAHWIHEITTAH